MNLLLSKINMQTELIKNVLQIDLSNLGALDNTPDWNFVDVLYVKDEKKEKIRVRLSDIMQFTACEEK